MMRWTNKKKRIFRISQTLNPWKISKIEGGTALEKAYVALTNYLRKKQSPKVVSGDEIKIDDYASTKSPEVIIDTTLLKAYIRTGNDLGFLFFFFFVLFWIDLIFLLNFFFWLFF